MEFILPYKAGERVYISSPYGHRTDPITGAAGSWHGGLDLVGQGDKTLCSPCRGEVLVSQIVTDRSNRTWEWGNYVCIQAEDGKLIYLCHMAERYVQAGDHVEVGDPIGFEGSTGYSTGSHCHFEVREGHTQMDPSIFLEVQNEAGTFYRVPGNEEREEAMDEYENTTDGNVPSPWAQDAVRWAQDCGILYGDENGNLKLRDGATREQMLVFLHRLYEKIKREGGIL